MYSSPLLILSLFLLFESCWCASTPKVKPNYRPQFHYSPKKGWLSDPNGLLYYHGEYHMFYQNYPSMPALLKAYWGHAVSKDLIHWEELGVALTPDKYGWVTSGSGVVDTTNSAGFGTNAIVLIYSQVTNFALLVGRKWVQSIAYSVDKGRTFTPYKGNPVIPNKGAEIKEFRDPKVLRHPHQNLWVGIMAANDVIRFYHSKDLKTWVYKSEFGGKGVGSHGGVWECPDLFPLKIEDKEYWVLLVSIDNSKRSLGGPNKGSATQYFIGQFDGNKFTTAQKDPLWFDYGPDNYAGVSFHAEKDGRVIVLAWMSNWMYLNQLPMKEDKWIGQMTLPRELSLTLVHGKPRLVSKPSQEVTTHLQDTLLDDAEPTKVLAGKVHHLKTGGNKLLRVATSFTTTSNASVCFTNDVKQEVCVGYNIVGNQISVSREAAANSIPLAIRTKFKRVATAPRIIQDTKVTLDIYLDMSSIEVFADGWLTSLTALYFTSTPLTKVELRQGPKGVMTLASAKVWKLRSSTTLQRTSSLQKSHAASGSKLSKPGFLKNLYGGGGDGEKRRSTK